MWSGPGPPSPLLLLLLLLHSCHVCVPPERQEKKRAEVVFIEFWLRKNANGSNTRGHKFLTGRKRKFQWNQISDSPAECLCMCMRAALPSSSSSSTWRYIHNKNWAANIWMWNAFIHSYSLACVSWLICIKLLTNTTEKSYLWLWLSTLSLLLLLNFKVKNILPNHH